jgi:hypothetical protein
MLLLVDTQTLNKPTLEKWKAPGLPRMLRTGRTRCCYTNHYQVNDGLAICTNTKCSNYLAETQVMKRHRVKRFMTGAWLFLFLAVFTFDDYSHPSTSPISYKKSLPPLTSENLCTELHNTKVLCPDEVFAQMMLESGNLKSYLVRHTNNMLGMRYPVRRMTTASGIFLPERDTIIKGNVAALKKYAGLNNYAVYDTWQDAVKDYKLWQDAHFSLNERYLTFLSGIYAEDAAYAQKIKSVMKRSGLVSLAN